MGKLVDPICYQLHFACVTEAARESAIKGVFRRIANSLKSLILPYLCDGWLKHFCVSSGPDGYPDCRFRWIGSTNTSPAETEDLFDALLLRLDEHGFHGFIMDGGLVKNEFTRYPAKATAFSKFYDKWFAVHRKPAFTDNEFSENTAEICRMMNCPTDDLRDVSVPVTALRNSKPFELALYRTAVPATENLPPHLRYRIVLPPESEDRREDLFLYQMRIVIPRFLTSTDEQRQQIQQQWYDDLLALGGLCPVCFGTMGMDAPPKAFIGRGNTVYDDAAQSTLRMRYFDGYIPGSGWATLIGRSQARLAEAERQGDRGAFSEIVSLENGNRCFRATPDLNIVPRETAIRVRQFFRPFYPPVSIDVWRDYMPVSLRLGFTEDEISYRGTDMFLFSVVH